MFQRLICFHHGIKRLDRRADNKVSKHAHQKPDEMVSATPESGTALPPIRCRQSSEKLISHLPTGTWTLARDAMSKHISPSCPPAHAPAPAVILKSPRAHHLRCPLAEASKK